MTQTVAKAAERAVAVSAEWAYLEKYTGDFAKVLPAHISPDTFVRLGQGLLRRNPDLAAAAKETPESLLAALLDCAQLGHRPGTDQYALTPRKVKGKNTVLGIEQYQGEIERMYRAGAVLAVKAAVVREKDYYHYDEAVMQRPDHRPGFYIGNPDGSGRPQPHARFAGLADRGRLVGVYAYAELQGGAVSRVIEQGKDEVMLHREVAATKDIWDGPFGHSMWLKTAIHELEKWVPTSAEYLRDRARAMAEAQQIGAAREAALLADVPPRPPTIEGDAVVTSDTGWPPTAQPPDAPRAAQ